MVVHIDSPCNMEQTCCLLVMDNIKSPMITNTNINTIYTHVVTVHIIMVLWKIV